ncbi:MAG: CDP-alcohol phosphatidyltransferase family protein [Bdellovibrionota bacterium]
MSRLKWVPNALSIFRMGLAGLFPFLPMSAPVRVTVIVIAALSEFLDGFLARRWNACTQLGQLLDPVADKLFVLATAGTLIYEGRLTYLQFFLLASRDIIVAIGTISVWVESKDESIAHLKPRILGKIATGFQFALLLIMFAELRFAETFLQITIVASALAAIDYLYTVLHRRFDRVSA